MLRSVLDSDLNIFFEQERDETARHMAAFVPKDPNDRDAFDAQWQRMRSSDGIRVRTIELDSEVVGTSPVSIEMVSTRSRTGWARRTGGVASRPRP